MQADSEDSMTATDEQNIEAIEDFNTDLPAEHTYLGNLERVSGVQYLEPYKSFRLPIFYHDSIIYPGETYPIILTQQRFLNYEFNDDGLMFALIFKNFLSEDGNYVYGVTCQIYEKSNTNASDNDVSIKSRAYQRLCVKKTEVQHIDRHTPEHMYNVIVLHANVSILPEIVLPDPLFGTETDSLSKYRLNPSCKNKLRKFQSELLPWPLFVYDKYNMERVLEKIKTFLLKMKIGTGAMDLVSLSFWFCQNAVLKAANRRKVFMTNYVLNRLILIADSLDDDKFIVCHRCNTKLTHYNKLFAMSKEGILTSYCNPAGFIHEIHTVTDVLPDVTTVSGLLSFEFTWFPGYAWRYLHCTYCGNHLGWKYFPEKSNLRPRYFYGLSGKSIRVESDLNEIPTRQSNAESEIL